jgi:hypothetical protein
MKIDTLKNEAKRLGLRITKKVKGKRVALTENELKMKIQRRRAPSLEIQVRESKKLLRTCKSLLRSLEPDTPRAPKAPQAPRPPVPPVPQAPRPPVPPRAPQRPVKLEPRANLMMTLKANLERRGIKQKLNQIS